MRYGQPSIPDRPRYPGARQLAATASSSPLYPQYAGSTRRQRWTKSPAAFTLSAPGRSLRFICSYHDDPGYMPLVASVARALGKTARPNV